MKILGKQLLVDYYNCQASLNDVKLIKKWLTEAAVFCKATVIKTVIHNFNPCGISGVVVIAESHLAIHTWPEYNYAAVDIFTCGDVINPMDAFEYLKQKFMPKSFKVSDNFRGLVEAELSTPSTFRKNFIEKISLNIGGLR